MLVLSASETRDIEAGDFLILKLGVSFSIAVGNVCRAIRDMMAAMQQWRVA